MDALASFLEELPPPACDVLRDYQREQLRSAQQAIRAHIRRILLQAPTGSGKTHEIAAATLAAHRAGLRVLILTTRTRLVRQIHERLEAFGVGHGVIAAQLPSMIDRFQFVQVASADTLYRRCLVSDRTPLPPADIVIFDEAHLAAADSRLKLLEQYPRAVLLGFTATPARKSGRPLREAFDHLILGPSVKSLLEDRLLVRPRIFSVPVLTKSELAALPKDSAGDYQTGAAAELLSREKLLGDVLENWLRIAAGKRSIVFACNKRHGAHLVDSFTARGVAAELLTDEDDESTREAVIGRLEAAQTTVVVNCFLMAYGVDLPEVECIVLARPMRSVVMYLQAVGRGLRAAPGKDCCILIDHGRVVESLGLPTADFGWSLEEGRNVNRMAAEATARAYAAEKPRTCPDCKHVWLVSELGNSCEVCGWAPAPTAKPVRFASADLHELGADAQTLAPHTEEVATFFREALGWYAQRWPDRWRERPKSARWYAWVKTRERFELADSVRMPGRLWEISPAPVSSEVNGWVYSRHIRDVRARRQQLETEAQRA
jgi:DNA repair protein RadD